MSSAKDEDVKHLKTRIEWVVSQFLLRTIALPSIFGEASKLKEAVEFVIREVIRSTSDSTYKITIRLDVLSKESDSLMKVSSENSKTVKNLRRRNDEIGKRIF